MSNKNNYKTQIWDIYIRVYHWLLAILVATSFISIKFFDSLDVHFLSGYSIVGLLIFRLIWGLFGSETAKFVNFIKSPFEIFKYMKSLLTIKGHKINYGHSPIAGLSVMAMLGILVAQTLSGLFFYDEEIFLSGPLAQYGSETIVNIAHYYHPIGANLVLTLIVIHLMAIAVYYFFLKDNLILPMITGWKKLNSQKHLDVKHVVAIFCMVFAAIIVTAIIYFAN